MAPLSDAHQQMLAKASGIADEVIAARGYLTITQKARLKELGFSDNQARVPALLIPLYGPSGEISLYQLRADSPRISRQGKAVKYETPSGSRMTLDVHPFTREQLGDPSVPLWITEGVKKGDALVTHGCCTIALIGVWNWRGTNEQGGKVALADWESVALNGRRAFIAFDSDVMTKEAVHAALARLGAFLEQRGAEVYYVYLPGGNSGAKIGVDDFLANIGTVDDLVALASPHLRKQDADSQAEYQETARGIVWRKPTKDGEVLVPLTNFCARITAEIIEDDGLELKRTWEIEAWTDARKGRTVVTPSQFVGMLWPGDTLGAAAIVEPGIGTKERARHAIQVLSGEPAQRHVYSHTGWRRINEQWLYLHAGGAMGPLGPVSGLETAFAGAARAYILPDPSDAERVCQAVRTSLSMLELAPDLVVVPALGSVFRAPLGPCDASVWIAGQTGTGKSELAALCVQHYGASMDRQHLPESWTSTANALEAAASSLKDCLLVVDDFAPEGTTVDIQRLHQLAATVIRRQGNMQGRSRLQANLSQRPARPPRGSLLATGEDVPRGHSVRARLLVCELGPKDLDFQRLGSLQAAAASGTLAIAMSAYIRWMAGCYDEILASKPKALAELREQAVRSDLHRRTPDITAQLGLGWKTWLTFAVDCGAVAEAEAALLWQRAWTALGKQAEAQREYQTSADPVRRFGELLGAALASGAAHVAARSGGEPLESERWGWRSRVLGNGEFARRDAQAQGTRIGWVEGETLYLEPDAAYAIAQRLGQSTSDPLTVQPKTLWRRLAERGVLAGRNEGRFTQQVRGLEGAQRRVITLHVSFIETGPSGPSGFTGAGRGDTESEDRETGPQGGATQVRFAGPHIGPTPIQPRPTVATVATVASGDNVRSGRAANGTDGKAVYAFHLAREKGFPSVSVRQGVSVLAGEDAWRAFVARASVEDILAAITALEALEAE